MLRRVSPCMLLAGAADLDFLLVGAAVKIYHCVLRVHCVHGGQHEGMFYCPPPGTCDAAVAESHWRGAGCERLLI